MPQGRDDVRVLTTGEVLAAARRLADDLYLDMRWHPSDVDRGYWEAVARENLFVIVARAAGALEFLRQHAGADSMWTARAVAVFDSKGDHQSTESGARAVGDLLRVWASQVEAGVAPLANEAARRSVAAVSTDLMSVVRDLLSDPQAHPAPAIVMCGAALEIALRELAEMHGMEPGSRATLSVLTTRLRQQDVLSKQEVKDVEMCAGLRNAAAHGEFEGLTLERAGLMEQHTNLLLRRIADLLA